ncbi:hypothetical protein [Frankia sp. EI5c]|nr:hypothetical protein [Frankia sp. EI5c]
MNNNRTAAASHRPTDVVGRPPVARATPTTSVVETQLRATPAPTAQWTR